MAGHDCYLQTIIDQYRPQMLHRLDHLWDILLNIEVDSGRSRRTEIEDKSEINLLNFLWYISYLYMHDWATPTTSQSLSQLPLQTFWLHAADGLSPSFHRTCKSSIRMSYVVEFMKHLTSHRVTQNTCMGNSKTNSTRIQPLRPSYRSASC